MSNVLYEEIENLRETNEAFKCSIQDSIRSTKVILEGSEITIPNNPTKRGKVVFSGKRTFQAGQVYARRGYSVGCLDFASSKNPGGGYLGNANAQEESLCRSSSLPFCLTTDKCMKQFYIPHRNNLRDSLYNDDCIYVPDVAVVRSDYGSNSLLQEKDWWMCDVVCCAAPNVGAYRKKLSEKDIYNIVKRRLERVVRLFASNDLDCIILGAFGCGVFKCPPNIVARALREVINEYKFYFDVIDIAIPEGKDKTVYNTFKRMIG